MIYEMRTYTLRPGSQAEVARNSGEVARRIRGDDYGRLEGYWLTEIGALNQVMHLWSYESFDERARLRAALGRNAAWRNEYLPMIMPHLLRQDIRLLNPLRDLSPPTSEGNVYEFRNYRFKPGRIGAWIEAFTGILPVRERYSPLVGLWQTEAGQPNEACHLWVYPDLNARADARAKALADPEWQTFLGRVVDSLDEMTSTVILPAAHSRMQ